MIVELPKEQHKRLKARALLVGKSMSQVVIEALQVTEECFYSDHYPNKETQKSLKNIEEGKNLTRCESLDILFKKI